MNRTAFHILEAACKAFYWEWGPNGPHKLLIWRTCWRRPEGTRPPARPPIELFLEGRSPSKPPFAGSFLRNDAASKPAVDAYVERRMHPPQVLYVALPCRRVMHIPRPPIWIATN